MPSYPRMIVPVDHIEPVPRRVRAVAGGTVVLDTVAAQYVWEWSGYPAFYVPRADVAQGALVDEGPVTAADEIASRYGSGRRHGLVVEGAVRPGAAVVYGSNARTELVDTVRFAWDALDEWFEEDEQVFVHPRSPYARVDALRSNRSVRVERDGVVLAEAATSVAVFETGLPTRYYLDRSAVDFRHLVASDTTTSCPYKGRTSAYWSVRISDRTYADVAWAYDVPTAALLPIAGLVAFYNEQVDITLDGRRLDRPVTHFFG